jgi:hypothetical protein
MNEEDADESYDRPFRNPLDDLISFPEAIVIHRQNILPSESNGWGIHLLLKLPRSIVRANLDALMTAAGYASEAGADPQSGLLRYMGSNAYVWGMVADGPERSTSVLMSYTPGGEGGAGNDRPEQYGRT